MWTLDLPSKPGWYWFYGDLYALTGLEFSPYLQAIQVKTVGDGLWFYQSRQWVERLDLRLGLWQPMAEPELPAYEDFWSMIKPKKES